MGKDAHGIAAAPHAGDQKIGQFSDLGQGLLVQLLADHLLEFLDHQWIGMGPRNRADHVKRVVDGGHPIPQGLVHGVLERRRAGGDPAHFGPQHFHAVHVGRLSLDILRAHEDHALHSEHGRHGGGGNAVHARTGFGDQPRFAHAPGQERLADGIVDLVGARVVEILPLEVYAGASHFLRQAAGMIQGRRPARIVLQVAAQLFPKVRVAASLFKNGG